MTLKIKWEDYKSPTVGPYVAIATLSLSSQQWSFTLLLLSVVICVATLGIHVFIYFRRTAGLGGGRERAVALRTEIVSSCVKI